MGHSAVTPQSFSSDVDPEAEGLGTDDFEVVGDGETTVDNVVSAGDPVLGGSAGADGVDTGGDEELLVLVEEGDVESPPHKAASEVE